MKNNHQEKKEIQLELPSIKTGLYLYMTKDAINFPSKPKVNTCKNDVSLYKEIQLSPLSNDRLQNRF